jgi:methanogenic corrinoid protein MtbC1
MSAPASVAARVAAAESLRRAQPSLAARAADLFLERHPDLRSRYGEAGRTHCVQDAAFHLSFLAGAVETGAPEAFAGYGRWTGRMLAARGIAPGSVAAYFELLGELAAEGLADDERAVLRMVVTAGAAGVLAPAASPVEGAAPLRSVQRVFLQAILGGERAAAATIAKEALREGAALLDVYADVLQESLYEVGRRWERNEITVADEHMATAVVQYVLAELYATIARSAGPRGTAVVTGVQGEYHQVGANLVADALEAASWQVRFLGANVPPAHVERMVEESGAALLGISVTMLFNVPQARDLIARVRATHAGRTLRVLVGGAAFRSAPELWREIGADGSAQDVRELQALISGW